MWFITIAFAKKVGNYNRFFKKCKQLQLQLPTVPGNVIELHVHYILSQITMHMTNLLIQNSDGKELFSSLSGLMDQPSYFND